jgi:hypothetical protein
MSDTALEVHAARTPDIAALNLALLSTVVDIATWAEVTGGAPSIQEAFAEERLIALLAEVVA